MPVSLVPPAEAPRRRGAVAGVHVALLGLIAACALDGQAVMELPYSEGAPDGAARGSPLRSRPPRLADGFALPFPCGTTVLVTQGHNTRQSHRDKGAWAWDFSVPRGSLLVAMAEGRVVAASGDVGPEDPCFAGGGEECAHRTNFVLVEHGDGTDTLYLHLDLPLVEPGDHVRQGDELGLSGSTGWSSGPHAHVQRQLPCGSWWCESVPTLLADAPDGYLETGDVVTSGNCAGAAGEV